MRHVPLFVTVSMLAAGCVSPARNSHGPLPSTLPDSLEFKITVTPIVQSTEYHLDRSGVLVEKSEEWKGSFPKRSEHRYRVSVEGWRRFEEKTVPLRIPQWKHVYQPPPGEMIYDGYGWELRWVSGNQRVESWGGNAGPSAKDPRRTLSGLGGPKSADIILADALAELAVHSRRVR